MRMTVLEIVQSVLSDMDSDEVDSISDTVESLQVANILKQSYYYLVSTNTFPEHKDTFTLTALANTDKPTHMQTPTDVMNVEWLRYDTQTVSDTRVNYTDVCYMGPQEFIEFVSQRDSSDTTVQTVTEDSGIKLLINNDKAPQWYTSFDDEYIVFDSFDSDVDTTLQQTKSLGFGVKRPTLSLSDNVYPDIDEHLFPLLLEETKSQAFLDLKQMPNQKAEARARKVLTQHQLKERRVSTNKYLGPDYGRRP